MRRLKPLLLIPFLPAAASACAVCFGAADNGGLITGLMITGALLLALVALAFGSILYLMRKTEKRNQKRFEELGLTPEPNSSSERWPFL